MLSFDKNLVPTTVQQSLTTRDVGHVVQALCTSVIHLNGTVKALVSRANDHAGILAGVTYASRTAAKAMEHVEKDRLGVHKELKEMREHLELSKDDGPGAGKGQGLSIRRKVDEMEEELATA